MRGLILTVFLGLVSLAPQVVGAESHMFMDVSGNIFFVDSINKVPERYRDQVVAPQPVDMTQREYEKYLKKREKEKLKKQKAKEKEEKRREKLKKKKLKMAKKLKKKRQKQEARAHEQDE